MTDAPRITIGITAHNAAATIRAALASALAQDWPNKEILIVDDASTDDTAAQIATFATNYPAVRFLQQSENRGVAAARNKIIAAATGDFIAFFDDDDRSAPARLTLQHARLLAAEKIAGGAPVICHTARHQLYPDGTQRYEPTMGMHAEIPHGDAVAAHILFNHPVSGGHGAMATCSQMARRSVYQALNGFDETFRRSEDTEFNLRLALAGGYFTGCAEPLVQQTMTLASDKKIADERYFTLKLYEKHRAVLEAKHRYAFDYSWIDAKHDFLAGKKIHFLSKLSALFLRHPLLTIERLYYATPSLHRNLTFKNLHKSA